MADEKNGKKNGLIPALTPVIKIDLTEIQDLSDTYSDIYQLNLQPKYDKKRKDYIIKLLEVEKELNTASRGEPHITIENRVDFASFPTHFKYTRENIAGEGVNLKADPAYLVGCCCRVCSSRNCSCPENSGGEFAYDAMGRVKVARRRPIYECNMKCRCDRNCRNRVVQRGRTVRVCIFRTKKKGWGLKTLEYIHANQFVTEYVGEILTSENAESRGKRYDQIGETYLFDLDYNEGECLFTIDAFRYGNVAHFINHSCDPNLVVYGVWIDNMDPHLPHIALFATRDINPGEELTFDYLMTGGDSSCSPSKQSKRMKCHCKASNCRNWLF